MVAVAAPVAQVADLSTLSPTAQAAALGYPAALFGFTPAERGYWHEPGLPWLTQQQLNFTEPMPNDYRGFASLLCIGGLETDTMAPRFPRGCCVHTMPVFERAQLVVGRVYTYGFRNSETGEVEYHIARLVRIGGNYLEAKPDNHEQAEIWLLCDEPEKATWDVREVTHYVSYPGE